MEGNKPPINENFIDETKKNQFGLPEKWSKVRSSQAIDTIRNKIVNNQIKSRESLDFEIKRILTIAGEEYRKYKGKDAIYNTVSSDLTDSFDQTGPYLKMDRLQKLEALKSNWPRGLPILRSNYYLKWETIIDYEMWAIKNHGQTFTRIANRNGLSEGEALAIISGINGEDTSNFNKERMISWFRETKMLMD